MHVIYTYIVHIYVDRVWCVCVCVIYVPDFYCECIAAARDISIRLGQCQLQMFFEWYSVDIRASIQVLFALHHPMHTWSGEKRNEKGMKYA